MAHPIPQRGLRRTSRDDPATSVAQRVSRWQLALVFLFLGLVAGCERRSELPVLGQVPAFSMKDQKAQAASNTTFSGKPWVAAFMFTRCPSICPRITAAMKELRTRALAEGIELRWVSFSVDPENDTPSVLEAYAREHGAWHDDWFFLTGELEDVRRTAEQGFKMAFDGKLDENSPHYGITHGSHLVLVDAQGQIRGYYRTLEPEAQAQLLKELKSL